MWSRASVLVYMVSIGACADVGDLDGLPPSEESSRGEAGDGEQPALAAQPLDFVLHQDIGDVITGVVEGCPMINLNPVSWSYAERGEMRNVSMNLPREPANDRGYFPPFKATPEGHVMTAYSFEAIMLQSSCGLSDAACVGNAYYQVSGDVPAPCQDPDTFEIDIEDWNLTLSGELRISLLNHYSPFLEIGVLPGSLAVYVAKPGEHVPGTVPPAQSIVALATNSRAYKLHISFNVRQQSATVSGSADAFFPRTISGISFPAISQEVAVQYTLDSAPRTFSRSYTRNVQVVATKVVPVGPRNYALP